MERKWEQQGLDLRLSPYGCVSTGNELGFIEVVLNSDTTANITKRYAGGAGGAFSKAPMLQFLREHNPSEEQCREAVETFLLSLAGYCVATFVIGIGDRHNDNVMLSKQGPAPYPSTTLTMAILHSPWLYSPWLYSPWLYLLWLYSPWLYSPWLYSPWLYSPWLCSPWLYSPCPGGWCCRCTPRCPYTSKIASSTCLPRACASAS